MSVDISKLLPILFEGFGTTLKIFGLTLLFSIPLGFIVSALKMCRIPPVRWIINAYILIMRGTPLILQIMFIYFAPTMLFKASAPPDRFAAVIVAFSINYAAYFAEIFRGVIIKLFLGNVKHKRNYPVEHEIEHARREKRHYRGECRCLLSCKREKLVDRNYLCRENLLCSDA